MFLYRLLLTILFLSETLLNGSLAYAESLSLPDSGGLTYDRYAASGPDLLLWVASERGLSEAEIHAAKRLAQGGTEVWQVDLASSYFLPLLPSSMDAVPTQDARRWLKAAMSTGKQVRVLAISRAVRPVLRAMSELTASERSQLCVALLYPNLYASADPLDEPAYLELGKLEGGQILLLQPRRSAATPWLPALMQVLQNSGVRLQSVMLEKLREGYWVRDDATAFEIEEGKRLDAMLQNQFESWACGK
jgi:hypothetical protein